MDICDERNTGQLNINALKLERLCFLWPSFSIFSTASPSESCAFSIVSLILAPTSVCIFTARCQDLVV